MKCVRKMLGALLFSIAIFAFVPTLTTNAEGLNGLQSNDDGNWYYFVDGEVNYGYTGLVYDEAVGWWLVRDGVIDFGYTGLWCDENFGWWLISGGTVAFDYTGLWNDPNYGWWLIGGGTVAFDYTGLWNDPNCGWWLIGGGTVAFDYTGLWNDPNCGWWLIGGGTVAFDYTGLWNDPNCGWWLISGGTVAFGYTGLWNDPNCGWWLISGGTVAFDYTGLWNDPNCGWWLVNGGTVAFGYTGPWNDAVYGWWLINGGTVAFDYTGAWDGQYIVNSGAITGTVDAGGDITDGTYQIGTKSTGEVESENVYLILSNANPNLALTVVEDTTVQNGYNLVLSELTGDESQKFWVVKDSNWGVYYFFSMKYYNPNGASADSKWSVKSGEGGWNPNTAAHEDNVYVSGGNEGVAGWYVTELASGEYAVKTFRGDDYEAYLSVSGQIAAGANVQADAIGNVSTLLTVNFASPYTKTLENGTYTIALSDDSTKLVSVENASVRNNAKLVAANKTYSSDQLFDITCIDGVKGLYTIKNHNSSRYLQLVGGSVNIGTDIIQAGQDIIQADMKWYIQKRTDGTYTIINASSRQVLTMSASGAVQNPGNDMSSQKFVFAALENKAQALETGVYSMGDAFCRFSYLGYGMYNIYSISQNGYLAASGNSVAVSAEDDSVAAKWMITEVNGQYVIQAVSNGKYLTSANGLANSQAALAIIEASERITNYAQRYDLSVLNTLDSSAYNAVQVVKRMNMLGLTREALLDPVSNMASIEADVLNKMSPVLNATNVIEVPSSVMTVADLNEFMRDNMGSNNAVNIIRLTHDIQVKRVLIAANTGTWDEGQVRIPSNVILDGDGHSLVNAATGVGDDILPYVGITFYYNYSADGINWGNYSSQNCGVVNLVCDIPYEQCTLTTAAADYVLIANNTFSNAKMSTIRIADDTTAFGVENSTTNYGIIRGNKLSNTTDSDVIGVYGNNSLLIIEDNTIFNSGVEGYGLMVSCLNDGVPVRVDAETTGPHDIIVRKNVIHDTEWCSMYCAGTYRVYVTDNKLYNSVKEGICFDSGCIGNYFAGNEVYNTATGGGLPGVSIDNGIYNIIDGNYVHDNACVGIKIVRAGYGNVIVNNVCTNNNKLVTGDSARSNLGITIEVQGFEREPESALYLDAFGSDANVVYNNTVDDQCAHGIAVLEHSGVEGNRNNVIKYNKVSAGLAYPTVDFTEQSNEIINNIVY